MAQIRILEVQPEILEGKKKAQGSANKAIRKQGEVNL